MGSEGQERVASSSFAGLSDRCDVAEMQMHRNGFIYEWPTVFVAETFGRILLALAPNQAIGLFTDLY